MIIIRKVTLDELPVVHKIETLSFAEGSYPLFVLRQLFDISENYFLVAEEDGHILGYAIGNLSTNDVQGWLLSLGVHPDVRGQNIGKSLTKKLTLILEDNGAKEICLTVHPDNFSAVKLYKDLGFEILNSEDNYYLDNAPRYLMKKKAVTNIMNS